MSSSSKNAAFETGRLGDDFVSAPDGSEIRLLHELTGGGLAHCTLPPGGVSVAVTHRTVEEVWYFLEGRGQVWLKQSGQEEVVHVEPGVSLTIPIGTHFQFRNTGDGPLRFVISTMPPWPGADEAVRVEGRWLADQGRVRSRQG